jgi:ATP-dependent RNA helicase RhlE
MDRVTYLFMTEEKNIFRELGVAPSLVKVLDQHKLVTPTPIQHQCIPVALEGKDVIGIAQTGTGKTLAFGLPMIQRIAKHKGQGLILLPTRELAIQVDEVLRKIGGVIGLRTAVLIGGAPMGGQLRELQRKPHIVIATPGRLNDHLKQKTYKPENICTVVLDEADRMLDIGFMPQIRQILSLINYEHQTLLFSATMPSEISEIAAKFMKLPLRIEVAPAGTPGANIEQEMYIVSKEDKIELLKKYLHDTTGTVIVFSRTKYGAKKITAKINQLGYSAVEIHSNRSLAQRKEAMTGFKSGKYRILVATDIAARGIDVNDITLVVNFDLPDNPEDYVHRIGRTGRAGKTGKAVSFATPDQKADIKTIERLIKKSLPILELPNLPKTAGFQKEVFERPDRPRFGGRGGRAPYAARKTTAFGTTKPRYGSEKPRYGGSASRYEKTNSKYAPRRSSPTPAYKSREAEAVPALWEEKRPRAYTRPVAKSGYSPRSERPAYTSRSNKPVYTKRDDKPAYAGSTPRPRSAAKPYAKSGSKPFGKKFDRPKTKRTFTRVF